jgi:hypothetical protein
MTKYNPTNLEVAELFSRVFCDKTPEKANAFFIHGEISDSRVEEPLFLKARDFWFDGRCEFLVVNGLAADRCQKLSQGYGGYEKCVTRLVELGIPRDRIAVMAPAENTAKESENFALMAKDNNWRTLLIGAAPYHQVRCFLHIIAAMKKIHFDAQVYNVTYHDVDWNVKVKRKVMFGQNILGQKDEIGPLFSLLRGEMERMERYAVPSPRYISSATFSEALKYLQERDD